MATTRRKGIALFPMLVITIVYAPGFAGERPVPQPNLLKNPGFETTDAKGFAANWGGGEFGKPGDNVQRDTQVKRSGEAGLRIAFKPDAWVTCASEKILLKANARYGIIWWVRTENMTNQSRAYAFLQLEGKQVTLSESDQKVNADWTRFAAEYLTPAHEAWVQLVFVTWGAAAKSEKTAYAWYDDALVIEGRVGSELPPSACPLKHGAWEVMSDLSDEFEGKALDPKKWKVSKFAWGDMKTAYTARNVTVGDGRLHFAIKKEAVEGKPDIAYTAGIISTLAKVRYGYFEAKCRLTKCLANNAFWLYLSDGDRAGLSEIDIFESTAAQRTDIPASNRYFTSVANMVNSTLHIESPVGRYWCPGTKRWQAPVGLDKDFHRYGLEWNEDSIIIYFDGELIHGFENTHHHHPLALLFNLTGRYAGFPPDADLPSTFDIEYVRAWRQIDVEDRRVWDFKFALPDRKQQYRVRTTDNGTLVIFTGGEKGFVKVDYLNPDFFGAQKDTIVKKMVEAKDKSGKSVCFHFEWRASVIDSDHNGYKPYRLYIEPTVRQPRGTEETFVFAAENGQELQLTITY